MNFQDWLQQALMKGTRAAHCITAYDSKPQEPVKEMVVEGRILVEPMEVMEKRVSTWSKYWYPLRAPLCTREVAFGVEASCV